MPAVSFRVSLSDDLAAFVAEAVRDGVFESADHLFAHAVALVRTQTALGYTPEASTATTPPTAAEVVDLTRQGFDGPAFMATLVDKLERRKDDEKKPPK
jgi:Arc/MetJ-type ribon-helix-helix transcriptional regulator